MSAPCVVCGGTKKQGHPLWCASCWEIRQPMQTQIRLAQEARAKFETAPPRPPKATWPDGHRWCAGCRRFRVEKAFAKTATQCKPCLSAKAHESALKRRFDITAAEYDAMLADQGGLCAICRRDQKMRRLAVHHDHRTGKVVALLCKRCNWDLLGAAGDSAVVLLRAYALQVGGWPAVRKVLDREQGMWPLWNPF